MLEVLPKIRDDIDAFIYTALDGDQAFLEGDGAGGDSFILYDKSGLSEAQLLVSADIMFFVMRMNGSNSLLKLRDEFAQESQQDVGLDELEEIMEELDKAKFLDNHNFSDLYRNTYNNFIVSPVRVSSSSGSVYSDDQLILSEELASLIATAPKPEMEGRIGNVMRRAPRGIIAPHMDFARAGKCYGQVYRELLQYSKPEAVVVFGTAHGKMVNKFAVCDKDFQLPSGNVEYHQKFTNKILLETASVADFKKDIFIHRSEHSIELQLVWLNYVWPGVKIIPILVGDMDEFIAETSSVHGNRQIQVMLQALHELISTENVTLVASADLSHIGRRFGDDRDLDKGFISETEVADRSYLRSVIAGDATAALNSLAKHKDRYHLCGTGCIYMLNALLPNVNGQLLGYYQTIDTVLEQAVGYAGVIFE